MGLAGIAMPEQTDTECRTFFVTPLERGAKYKRVSGASSFKGRGVNLNSTSGASSILGSGAGAF